MDISAFSDDNFDTIAWVNNILNNAENEKKENYTMSLVMKLQLYVQQVNLNLEQTSEQVLESLPKIMQDIRSLREEAQILKDKMAVVKDEVIKIEQGTGKSITNIEHLDIVKTKLIQAKQGLHESDNWTVLVNEMEELFDIKNIDAIASKLNSMQNSLKLLVNVSDYEDRKLQLEGLKNRLEAIASPAIVQAFTENNAEQAIVYSRIFLSIGRTSQLLKYYHKCQRDILLKKWRDQLDVEQEETVIVWVHNFYDILLSNWHTQHKWFFQVFPTESVSKTIIDLYADVLQCLDPSIEECIEAALKQTSDKLAFLLEIKQITKQFVTNFLAISDTKDTFSTTSIHPPLLIAIYRPLSKHLRNYVTYERSQLLSRLPNLAADQVSDSPTDIVAAIGRSGSAVLDSIGESRRRCRELTEQCGYCGLLVAVRACLVAHADQYRVAVKHLDRNRFKGEDWNTFQLCFSLLQHAGDMLLKINQVEVDVTSCVLELQRNDAVIDYKTLLLNDGDRKELQSLIRCVAEGREVALLDHVTSDWSKLCADIHHLIGQVALAPALRHLETVQRATTWAQYAQGTSSADAPDYSFTPQEYITEIGQYLMTLPQHLEPFLFRENPALTCAFRAARPEYNRAHVTNQNSSAANESGTPEIEAGGTIGSVDSVGNTTAALTNVFLSVIVKATCQAYSDAILNICELNAASGRQLAHDIGYLGNIVEDLGLSLTDTLQQISALLRIPTDQYITKSAGYSARHVAAIRQIRNITSS